MNITIKNLKETELNQAAEVFYKAFNSVGENWTQEISLKRLKQNYHPDTFWAAKVDSKIIGILASKIDYVLDHKKLYIDVIAVLPEYQKIGVGKKLWNIAEEYACSNKLVSIWLSASTKLPSFEWYKKLGLKQSSWVAMYKII